MAAICVCCQIAYGCVSETATRGFRAIARCCGWIDEKAVEAGKDVGEHSVEMSACLVVASPTIVSHARTMSPRRSVSFSNNMHARPTPSPLRMHEERGLAPPKGIIKQSAVLKLPAKDGDRGAVYHPISGRRMDRVDPTPDDML